MIAAMFVLLLAALPRDSIYDAPIYEDTAFGVRLPRPFEDWVFVPAATPTTTTVIFHPRAAALGEQLWGALVLARFGRPVIPAVVADQRVSTTWRATLGPSFRLLVREDTTVSGLPAVHVMMSGAISHAVLEVEEYLVARDSALVLLQLRYPRGLPHDSIAAGYQRSIAGLWIRSAGFPAPGPAAGTTWSAEAAEDGRRFELPDSLRAVSPGTLTAEAVSGGRRRMHWTYDAGPRDTSLYSVGSYRLDVVRLGRLTVRAWRLTTADTGVARITDSVLSAVQRGWAFFWRAFGPIPRTEVSLVETRRLETRGASGTVFLGRERDPVRALLRELARAWWGGLLDGDSSAARLVRDILPEWAGFAARSALDRAATPEELWSAASPGANALERARSRSGAAAFAEAIRSFAAQARDRRGSLDSLLRFLDPDSREALREVVSRP